MRENSFRLTLWALLQKKRGIRRKRRISGIRQKMGGAASQITPEFSGPFPCPTVFLPQRAAEFSEKGSPGNTLLNEMATTEPGGGVSLSEVCRPLVSEPSRVCASVQTPGPRSQTHWIITHGAGDPESALSYLPVAGGWGQGHLQV